MKPSQVNASSLGRISDPTKNALNRKENPPDKPSIENPATNLKRAGVTNRAEVASSLQNGRSIDKPASEIKQDSPQISEYMKMISRFENKVKQDQVEDKDLERVMKALEDKVLSLSPQQQNRIKMLEIFRNKGIENFNNMKDVLIELFENKADQEKFFDFLKSPEFVTILLNEPEQPKGYAPAHAFSAAPNNNGEPSAKADTQRPTAKKA